MVKGGGGLAVLLNKEGRGGAVTSSVNKHLSLMGEWAAVSLDVNFIFFMGHEISCILEKTEKCALLRPMRPSAEKYSCCIIYYTDS